MGDLKLVFYILLIDLNGMKLGENIVIDVDYDVGIFIEGGVVVDIVSMVISMILSIEEFENFIFNDGLIIKDYINVDDFDNIIFVINVNGSGVVFVGGRLV